MFLLRMADGNRNNCNIYSHLKVKRIIRASACSLAGRSRSESERESLTAKQINTDDYTQI